MFSKTISITVFKNSNQTSPIIPICFHLLWSTWLYWQHQAFPPTTITTNGVTSQNPTFFLWICQDQLILNIIVDSLFLTIMSFIARVTTSCEAWTILSKTHATPSCGHIKQVKNHLKNPTKGSQSVIELL